MIIIDRAKQLTFAFTKHKNSLVLKMMMNIDPPQLSIKLDGPNGNRNNIVQEKDSLNSNQNNIVHSSLSMNDSSSSSLSNSLLQEGNDIYLTCQLDANPRPLKPILWRFNGKALQLNSMPAIKAPQQSSQAANNNNNLLQQHSSITTSGSLGNQLMILNNQSLVLRKVSRQQSGLYTCEASNQHGSNSSKPMALIVRHAPVCSTDDM